MTDDDRTTDELVSAYLDGEATAEEQARVEGDPALQARLAVFTSVRNAVGVAPPPPEADERDALLTRVMGAAIAPAKVVSLRRRRIEPARVVAVAAAIFAIAFLGGAVALLAGGSDRNGDDDSAAVAEDSSTALSTAGLGTGATTTAAGSSRAAVGELGSFPDEAALRAGLEAVTNSAEDAGAGGGSDADQQTGDQTPPAADTSEAPSSSYSGPGDASCSADPTATVYRAQLAGEPVLVIVGSGTATVVRESDCVLLATFAQ
jgi:hypothetical protein